MLDPGGHPVRSDGALKEPALEAELETTGQQSVKTAEVLTALLQGTASATGDDFFCALVKHLAQALSVKYAFVAELSDDKTHAYTRSLWTGEGYGANFDYAMAGTACEPMLEGRTICYTSGMQQRFPDDPRIRFMQAESYLGVPLLHPSGEVIGHVVAVDDKPMVEAPHDFSAFEIFAARASAELQRRRTQRALEYRLAIEALISSISTGFISLPSSETGRAIDDAIAEIGRFSRVDRVWLVMMSDDGKSFTYAHEWCADSIPSSMPIGYVMDRKHCPLFIEGTDRTDILHIPRVSDLPDSERDLREAFIKDQVKSGLIVPLLIAGKAIGAIAFDSVTHEKTWSEEDIRLLKLVAEVFAQAIDRQRAEEELNRAHVQLIQSEKMASLGQITAGIAHEINSPIAVIRSGADVITRTTERLRQAISNGAAISAELRAELTKCIDVLERNGAVHGEASSRISDIVSSLKAFTRLDEAQYLECNLNEGLESVLTLLTGNWKEGVCVERQFGDIPNVRAYASELNQVFMTLLRNANEAIEGKGTVTVRTSFNAGHVCVQINDTGRGIPSEQLSRLFDVGFSSNGSRVRMRTGLSNSYAVVQKHKGELQVSSAPGKGTEFRVLLPVNGA